MSRQTDSPQTYTYTSESVSEVILSKLTLTLTLFRRFPMEPFLETLLVPISAWLCPLGVAILRY